MLAATNHATRRAGTAPSRRELGSALCFAAGVWLAYLWRANEPVAVWIAILVLVLADSAAVLVGQRFGATQRMPTGAGENAATSIAFFATAFAVSAVGLVFGVGLRPGEALVSSALVAAVTTGVHESLDDGLENLFVPIGVLVSLELTAL